MKKQSCPARVEDYVFLSDPDLFATYCIERSGRVRLWQEEEAPFFLPRRKEAEVPYLFMLVDLLPEETAWNWVQGYLPILQVTGTSGKTLFLAADADGNLLLKKPDGAILRWPGGEPVSRDRWEENFRRIENFWQNYFATGIKLDEKTDWKSALVQARCGFCGNHPRYGVETYGDFRSDGFPPAILSMAETEFRLGHREMARSLAGYYLERFIQPDGTIDYYGPSISEYGDLLRLGALLGQDEDGRAFLRENLPPLLQIARKLYRMMNNWVSPEITKTFHLIRGVPEADTRDAPGAYFHNNLAVLRGFYELSDAIAPVTRPEVSAEMRYMAEILARRLTTALAAFRHLPFLPWRADFAPENLPQTMTGNYETAYANYRYYPEMLQSGLLPAEDALRIIQARKERGGEEFGMTILSAEGHFDWLDNWPIASLAKGMLEYGARERFEEILNGHRNFYQTQDTFTAYECISRSGDPRPAMTDWCIPAQLALPLMLLLKKEFRPLQESRRLKR